MVLSVKSDIFSVIYNYFYHIAASSIICNDNPVTRLVDVNFLIENKKQITFFSTLYSENHFLSPLKTIAEKIIYDSQNCHFKKREKVFFRS